MNVKRFHARTAREALSLARQAFGDDAVVLSTKPCAEGVEVLALAPESVPQIGAPAWSVASSASVASRPAAMPATPAAAAIGMPASPAVAAGAADSGLPSMSTLSFRDYVRERMLRRRHSDAVQAAAGAEHGDASAPSGATTQSPPPMPAQGSTVPAAPKLEAVSTRPLAAAPTAFPALTPEAVPTVIAADSAAPTAISAPDLSAAPMAVPTPTPATPLAARRQTALEPTRHITRSADETPARAIPAPSAEAPIAATVAAPPAANDRETDASRSDQTAMMAELQSMKGLIEDRFGALAFMDRMQRQPGQARLSQKLLDAGFSPAFTRSLLEQIESFSGDEMYLASRMLETNLVTDEHEAAIEDQGGIYALIGSTGVGKTTSTAKIAAAFASKHGAANLGLVTLDGYRVAAHEQLRAYGRILGVPVHTAHDRATLDDLLGLLSAKKMVLIDTAGMAQRDERTRELLDTLAHDSIKRLLVVNTAAQGETIDDVMMAYGADRCAGVVLSKMDEAVKLGPALDAVIRHKMKVVGIADGQRVPEDWRRMSAQALVHQALQSRPASHYRMDAQDATLICAGAQRMRTHNVLSMAA